MLDYRRWKAMSEVGELIHASSLPPGRGPLELRFRDNAATACRSLVSSLDRRFRRGVRFDRHGGDLHRSRKRLPDGFDVSQQFRPACIAIGNVIGPQLDPL